MTIENRLVDIELKLARQEDEIDALNKLVFQQQKKIDELESMCAGLAMHIRELRDAATDVGPASDKPPHY